MKDWREVRIDERGRGWRVDAWLSRRFSSWSRTAVAREIAAGRILSEERPLKPSSILRDGEVLRITTPRLAPVGPPPPLPRVVYEDERLLVFDKPPGLLTHPVGVRFEYGLVGLARDARPDAETVDLAHRIDRDTSGLVVLTKDRRANAHLKAAFKGQRAAKIYLAIVRGDPPWDEIAVDAPVGRALDSAIRLRRGVNPEGLPARSDFAVLRRLGDLALVQCRIHTGRTHQIRVHLEHLGHPLLGDKIYGQPDLVFLHHLDCGNDALVRRAVAFPRHALHAFRLTIPHPNGGEMTFEAPLAPDLQVIMDGAAPGWPEE